MPGFDLGDVENVIDDGEQRLARGSNQLQTFALLRGELRLQRNLRQADDRVHRRANLVAHVGQELGLCPIGLLGCLLGHEQLRVGAFTHLHFPAQLVVGRDQVRGALADLDLEIVFRPE